MLIIPALPHPVVVSVVLGPSRYGAVALVARVLFHVYVIHVPAEATVPTSATHVVLISSGAFEESVLAFLAVGHGVFCD